VDAEFSKSSTQQVSSQAYYIRGNTVHQTKNPKRKAAYRIYGGALFDSASTRPIPHQERTAPIAVPQSSHLIRKFTTPT